MYPSDAVLDEILYNENIGDGDYLQCTGDLMERGAAFRKTEHTLCVKQIGLPESPLNVLIAYKTGEGSTVLGCWRFDSSYLEVGSIKAVITQDLTGQFKVELDQQLNKEHTLLVLGLVAIGFLVPTLLAVTMSPLWFLLTFLVTGLGLFYRKRMIRGLTSRIFEKKWEASINRTLLTQI